MTTYRYPEMPVAVQCALGRIFGMLARPSRPGDIVEYERCRAIVEDYAEAAGIRASATGIGVHRPGWNFGMVADE